MLHRIVAPLVLLIVPVFAGLPAQAEDEVEWSLHDATTAPGILHSAMICPDADEETGNMFCLSLGCQVEEPLAWHLYFAGRIVLPEARTIQFRVDDTEYAVIDLTRLPGPEMQYTAIYDPARDAGLVDHMRRGTRGVVVITAVATHHRPFALAGADRAFDTVMNRCPVAE